MNPKYEFTGETMDCFGYTLRQIEAIENFGDVKKGDIGGWIETEKNLSMYGNAWVSDDARVFGNARVSGDALVFGNALVSGDALVFGNALVSGDARVFGNARVSGDARVSDDARVSGDAWVSGDARVFGDALVSDDARVFGQYDYILIGAIGSRNDATTFFRLKQGGIGVKCGCFFGTIDEFEKAVHKTHAGNEHEKAYMAAIRMVKEVMIHD